MPQCPESCPGGVKSEAEHQLARSWSMRSDATTVVRTPQGKETSKQLPDEAQQLAGNIAELLVAPDFPLKSSLLAMLRQSYRRVTGHDYEAAPQQHKHEHRVLNSACDTVHPEAEMASPAPLTSSPSELSAERASQGSTPSPAVAALRLQMVTDELARKDHSSIGYPGAGL